MARPIYRIVVARYKEDTGWLSLLNARWRPIVIQKGVDLPNRGREPTSFLWAILKYYDQIKPNDVWAFVQGNPFPHTGDFIGGLNSLRGFSGFAPLSNEQPVVVTWSTGQRQVFTEPFITDRHGNPHHPGVPVGQYYEKWLSQPFPETVRFYPGGQFIVDGASILQKNKEFYQTIFDDVMSENNSTPYVMERLWPSIFI